MAGGVNVTGCKKNDPGASPLPGRLLQLPGLGEPGPGSFYCCYL